MTQAVTEAAPVSPPSAHVELLARPSRVRSLPPAWQGATAAACTLVVAGATATSPAYGIAAAVALGILVLLATQPVLTALVLVAVVPVTSGLRRGLVIPGFRLSEVLVLVGAAVILTAFVRERELRWRAIDWLAFAYATGALVFGTFDLVQRGAHISNNLLQVMAGPLQFFLVYRCVVVTLRTPRRQRLALRTLLLASIPVSLLAMLDGLGPPAIHQTLVSITGTQNLYADHGFVAIARVSGVFPIWHALAGYLLVPLMLAFALLLERERTVLPRTGLLLVVALATVAVMLTLTFTVLIAVCVGALMLARRYQRLPHVAVGLAIAAAVLAVAFGSQLSARMQSQQNSSTISGHSSFLPYTVQYRLDVWRSQYAGVMREHYVTGYGPDYPPGVAWQHTESGYLTLLLRGGIPYLLIAVGLIIAVYTQARARARHAVGAPRALAHAVMVLCILIVPMNALFPYFTASGMPQALWPLWALVTAA